MSLEMPTADDLDTAQFVVVGRPGGRPPRDKHGADLRPGDRVMVEAEVRVVQATGLLSLLFPVFGGAVQTVWGDASEVVKVAPR